MSIFFDDKINHNKTYNFLLKWIGKHNFKRNQRWEYLKQSRLNEEGLCVYMTDHPH
jgi:hypothetical protein